jgi:ribosomal protein L30E
MFKMAQDLAEMYDDSVTQVNELKGFTKNFVRRGKEKKVEDKEITELLTFARENKLILGTRVTEKAFKNGKAQKVFVASNCDELTLKKIQHYATIANVEVVQLDLDNKELGQKLAKPFLVSMVCVRA